ncbi:GmrSD restriction endonuclease domain-containing protein [Streptomyces griseorubiginosus]|uniref:GmrSD restriction endonuclease domain-containing protein n=1 Tax=Streptomyces griseorubiginosus TaxID=67304 RepID=UPI003456E88E
MHAQETTFKELVQGEKQFQVPLYQRTYSWQQDELQQLWDDVLELVEEHLEGRTPATHFLGSVVLAPGRITAGGMQRWLVVDGQQRLTTLMLALTALRDRYRERGAERDADRIHDLVLVNRYRNGDDHYRLLPTQADREAFTACVENTPKAGGPGNVGAAYRFFLAVLTEGEENGGEAWTGAVETVLSSLLSIVEITAAEGDNVYRIFESINNTGVGLRQSDLLRNYLFMCLQTRGESVYRNHWLPMQDLLGPDNLELLVWLDLVVAGNSRAKQSEIYRDQKKRLEPLSTDEAALEAQIASLARRAERLMRILEPRREPDPELREVLERLFRWGGQTHYPLALQLLDRVDDGRATPQQAARALAYAESYMVRRLLAGLSTTGSNRVFMEMPKELEKDDDPADAVRRFLSRNRTGARVWPGDEALREAVRTRPFYKAGRSNQRFQVLRRLEESYDGSEPVDYAKASLTVEHVLPQSPAQQWYDLLAEDAEDGQSPDELHALLVHTLGNLTLSADNARLSNHPFRRKQEILDASALRMNQRIAAEERWARKEILARADELADKAVRLWPGPAEGVVQAEDEWAGWKELRAALLAMPAGTWTTYGDVAALIGTHAVPVGQHLATRVGLHGAYRVLTADGRVSAGFRWPDGKESGDARTRLEAEGVPFDDAGRARRSHRLTTADLAALLGRDTADESVPSAQAEVEQQTKADRFEAQLRDNQTEETVQGVLGALRYWEQQGGHLAYGRADETSCFPMVRFGDTRDIARALWPLGIYPVAGTVEVVFQYLKRRPPFDDEPMRRELMIRLNGIEGIDLAEAKLDLRPSFPLEVFSGHSEEICAVLEWFAQTAALAEARRMMDDGPDAL